MIDSPTPQPPSRATRKRGLAALLVGSVVAVVIVVVALTLSNSGPSSNAGLQSWVHKVVYANPSLILLEANLSQATTAPPAGENVNDSAICAQGESVARTLQQGPYPPVPSISATYARYLSAATAVYQSCVVAYGNPTTATTAGANLVKQGKLVVQIGDQLNDQVQADGSTLAPPVP